MSPPSIHSPLPSPPVPFASQPVVTAPASAPLATRKRPGPGLYSDFPFLHPFLGGEFGGFGVYACVLSHNSTAIELRLCSSPMAICATLSCYVRLTHLFSPPALCPVWCCRVIHQGFLLCFSHAFLFRSFCGYVKLRFSESHYLVLRRSLVCSCQCTETFSPISALSRLFANLSPASSWRRRM
jgi:hypothetical protein